MTLPAAGFARTPGLRRAPQSGWAWRSASGWWVIRVLQSEDLQQGLEWRYDISRINELRRLDLFYRLFQPAIQLLARLNRNVFRDSLPAGLPRNPGGRAAAVLAGRRIPRPGASCSLCSLMPAVRVLCFLRGSARAAWRWRCWRCL